MFLYFLPLINGSATELPAIMNAINWLLGIFGGIVGIQILFILLRWYEFKKLKYTVIELKNDIKELKELAKELKGDNHD